MTTCYPQPGKPKSAAILRRFAIGFGAQIETEPGSELRKGAAAFYGVVGIEHLLRQARTDNREWFYLDNAFFDRGRGDYFRIGHNRLQHDGIGKPDYQRMKKLGIEVKPWKRNGRHIVVCAQSDHFLREVCGIKGGLVGWLGATLATIRAHTDRPIIVRDWSASKAELRNSLQADLQDAWALVTHMSAAANEALLAGVPAFTTGVCAATKMGYTNLHNIEQPCRDGDRAEWAAVLCGQQWTLTEIEDGIAKEMLCEKAG